MIMTTQRWLFAAFAALAALSPTSAFFAGVPGASARSSPAAALRSFSSLSFDATLPQASSSRAGQRSLSRSVGGALSMSAETALEQKGLVTVYHKETCPYCKKTFTLLEEGYSLQVSRVDVLEGDDSDKKIKQMKTFSGRNTVPQIFFNSDHIGGNDDLQTLHEEGKLEAMVTKIRAEAPGNMKDSWYHPWY